MKILPLTLSTLAASMALAGCSGGAVSTPTPTPDPTFTVSGTMTLSRVLLYGTPGDSCYGIDGYDDITEGAQVRITDADGTIVALGALSEGVAMEPSASGQGTLKCQFEFSVPDVPDSGSVYGVEVSHRGIINFTRDEADSVALTLG